MFLIFARRPYSALALTELDPLHLFLFLSAVISVTNRRYRNVSSRGELNYVFGESFLRTSFSTTALVVVTVVRYCCC